MPLMYQVEHYTLCDGWVNCWQTYKDQQPTPTLYETREEAEADLRDFIAECMTYFQSGELDSPPSWDEWRVSAVYVQQQQMMEV